MPEKKRSIPSQAGSRADVISTARALALAALVLCALGGWAMAIGVSFSGPVNFPVGAAPTLVAVTDFNGDGKLDLVVPSIEGSNISVLLGNGDGTFQPSISYPIPIPSNWVPLLTADFNGDGKLDLVVTDSNGTDLTVLLGNGDGTFQSAGTVRLAESPSALASVRDQRILLPLLALALEFDRRPDHLG